MSSSRFQIEYTALSIENLRVLPKTVATQIIRKISRLENGLTGNIKRCDKLILAIGYAWAITGFCLMSKMIQS